MPPSVSFASLPKAKRGLKPPLSLKTHTYTPQTRVGCSLSALVDLLSGVVQGSGLEPVSFLIFIDDLAKVLENKGIIAKKICR